MRKPFFFYNRKYLKRSTFLPAVFILTGVCAPLVFFLGKGRVGNSYL